MRFAVKLCEATRYQAITQCLSVTIRVRGGGTGGAAATPTCKFSGQTLFSGQAQVAQKS